MARSECYVGIDFHYRDPEGVLDQGNMKGMSPRLVHVKVASVQLPRICT